MKYESTVVLLLLDQQQQLSDFPSSTSDVPLFSSVDIKNQDQLHKGSLALS